MSLFVVLVSPDAKLPARGDGDAGYDLFAVSDGVIPSDGSVVTVGLGLKLAIPVGHYGRIAPRSGLAVKHNVATAAGVIDSSYRGIVKVALYLTSGCKGEYSYVKGDRIAQLVIERINTPNVVSVATLGDTVRGECGFGSTGV